MNKMKKAMACTLILTMITMFSFALSVPTLAVTGPATDTIIFRRVPVDLAAEAVKKGDIDYYIYGLRPAQAEALAGVEGIDLYYAPSALVDIGLNPAPAPAGELNPLSIREVRLALNYLMDRDYVVSQIYKGFASSMVTFLSSFDPDFVTIYDIVAKYEFKYDPTIAASMINTALTKAGASKQEGKWSYKGKPITLKFIIRTEDERREIGDSFAIELEKLGFTVNRLYMPFGQAIPIIYGTDPKDLQWQLYTEGWGKSVVEKYDYSTINQFGCPWYTWMPGWQEAGYWQYENSTLDVLGKKILRGEFSSKAERDSLYKNATEMIIQESVRIWAATRLDTNPARSEVKGLTQDLGTGLRSPYNPREVYISGKTTVTVGHLWVWTEASVWNPIAGFDDVYSNDIARAIHDPTVWRHPFSGKPIPFRWSYTVETAGPKGKLAVPSDAFLWNNVTDSWKTVGSGVTATSKVTFDLSKWLGAKWHNGQTITWADFLYSLYQHYELAYDVNKAAIESSTSALLQPIFALYKGYRIVGNNLEVYLDYWHFDPNYIADYADVVGGDPPMLACPWEIEAGSDRVVFEKKTAAYSQSAAEKFGVPWLSMVLKTHAEMVNTAIGELKAQNFLPENVFKVADKVYATSADAAARFDATMNWFKNKGHLVISDGPFYLNVFDPAAQYAELKAFRDPTYPFSKGDWFYGIPTPPEIVKVGIPTVVPGTPASLVIEVSGVPPLGVKYLIRDPLTAKILKIGDAEGITATRFVVRLTADFTSNLAPGLYELTMASYSEEVAFVSTGKVFFDVLSFLPLEKALTNLGISVSTQLSTVSTNLANAINSVDKAIASLTSTVNTLMAIVAVLIVLVVVDIALSLRKK